MEILKLKSHSENYVLMASASVSCGSPQEICTELERVDLNEFATSGDDVVNAQRRGF